jgi:hypothetical protein
VKQIAIRRFCIVRVMLSGFWLAAISPIDVEASQQQSPAAQASESSPMQQYRGKIAILGDDRPHGGPPLANPLADRLRQAGFTVTVLDAQQVCDRHALTAEEYFLYVVPYCSSYPAAGFEALTAFIEQRGHVLFLGGPLLDDPIWRLQDRWLNRRDVLETKRNVRAEHRPLSMAPERVGDWTRTSNLPRSQGAWEVLPEGPDGETCFRFSCENLTGWDGYLSPTIPQLFGQQHDLLTFLAKGGPRTDRLVIEIQEQDGSRWMAVTELTTQWQRISLDPHDFQYWPDSSTREVRGGAGDRLRPEQARRVNFQLAQSHAPTLPQGEHRFWITDIGTCVNPVRDLPLAQTPPAGSLETIFPRYKVYPLDQRLTIQLAPGQSLLAPTAADAISTTTEGLHCAIPRTMGRGLDRSHKWRYVPLLDATDASGTRLGSPAWLVLQHSAPRTGSVLAGLGLHDPAVLASPTVLDLVCAISNRLWEGALLKEAGTEHFAYWPGEPIQLGAAVVNVAPQTVDVSVRVTIRDQDGSVVRTAVQSSTELAGGQEHTWRETWNPPDSSPAVYSVTTELFQADRVLDRIVHEVAVLDTRPADPSEFIRVSGSDFVLNGQKWYPVGVNFWPLYVSGMDQDDFWAGWLRSAYYEPELVEEDLLRMKSLGINLVSIQANDPQYYRNLLDFTRRCAAHGIYVNLFCGLASPLAFREQPLREFIETARLADNPTIMAYDTIWEPGNYVFQGDRRAGWDSAWRAWVIEQYGSIEAAEADWQFRDGATASSG